MAPAAPAAGAPPWERLVDGERAGKGRVLIVDDEVAIVRALRRALGKRFDVVGVHSGSEALGLLEAEDSFDVILCDLVMPGVNGMELYDRVVLQHPELLPRFVFVTGGGTTLRTREFLAHVAGPRIDKPFLPDEVLRLVESLMPSA